MPDRGAQTETPDRDQPTLTAMGHLPAHLRFWIVSVSLLCLDLWSKAWIFANLDTNEVRSIFGNFLDFRRSLNDGAVFGSFTGRTELFIGASVLALGFVLYMFCASARKQRVLQIALGMVLAGALGNLYDRCVVKADIVAFQQSNGQVRSVIGKLVGDPDGPIISIGDWPQGKNPRTFQRDAVSIRHQGVVRDFIKFLPKFPAWVPKFAGADIWPWVFNVAHSALVCGVILLLISPWFDRPAENE